MRRLLAACGMVVGLSASTAAGQEAHLNVLLFEKSYAGAGTPAVLGAPGYYAAVAEPDLLAEAQIAPHVALRRGLVIDELKYGTGHGLNVFLTPQIRLRGYSVASGPVRSLSFMPKFTFQWLWARGRDPDPERSADPGARHTFGPFFIFGHHSNGGSTCEFRDQLQDVDGACVFAGGGDPPPASAREVWVEGGNFSTNYVEGGWGYRYGVTSDDPTEHWRWLLEGALSWQHHHTWFGFPLPGGADEAFGELYGLDRVRVDGAGHKMITDFLAVRGSFRVDAFRPEEERFEGARDYAAQTDLFVQYVGKIRDSLPSIFGLGVRYSRGMDYYNTQYVRDISHFQVVAFLDLWSPILE